MFFNHFQQNFFIFSLFFLLSFLAAMRVTKTNSHVFQINLKKSNQLNDAWTFSQITKNLFKISTKSKTDHHDYSNLKKKKNIKNSHNKKIRSVLGLLEDQLIDQKTVESRDSYDFLDSRSHKERQSAANDTKNLVTAQIETVYGRTDRVFDDQSYLDLDVFAEDFF